jgi:thiamine-monophosphate kinase
MKMNELTLKMLEKSCLFCNPEAHGQGKQILLKSDNFYLFAGLGAVTDGLVIIAPYECYTSTRRIRSLSEVPPDWMDELSFLRLLVAEFYRENFGEGMLTFEHGRAGACLVSDKDTKHCFHAHLCCYPFEPVLPTDIDEEKYQSLVAAGANETPPLWEDSCLVNTPFVDFHELKEKVGESAYILMESVLVDPRKKPSAANREQWHHRVICLGDSHKLESQYVRRLLANRQGTPERWDWKVYPELESAYKTKSLFDAFIARKETKYRVRLETGCARLSFSDAVVASNAEGNDAVSKEFAKLWGNRLQHQALGEFFYWLKKVDKPKDRVQRVLDGGCGPANYCKTFYYQGLECVGTDISKDMLAIAQDVVGALTDVPGFANPPPRPSLLHQDVMAPDFPSEFFEAIWYSAILVHVPRQSLRPLLERLRRILVKGGILYISAQIDGGTNQRVTARREGRIFFYYRPRELRDAFRNAGFEIVREWEDKANIGSRGDLNTKIWRQFILKKSDVKMMASTSTSVTREIFLSQLGEAQIHNRILERLSQNNADKWVDLAPSDDCAALSLPNDELTVISTDPCPLPVLSMLKKNDDPERLGWFSMVIGLSDIAAMGAMPKGMLLALEAPESTTVETLDAFYKGALEAGNRFGCPIVGGNVKDAKSFSCVSTVVGSVRPDRMLKRSAAEPDEQLVVLGEMGLFWSGVLAYMERIELDDTESARLMAPLERPVPRVAEGLVLVEKGLSRCAMDSSDGLTACFQAIAEKSGVDINIDLQMLTPLPEVAKVAEKTGVDPEKLMLAWGDWQLVITAKNAHIDALYTEMAKLGCPVTVVGWVSNGDGRVWIHDRDGRKGQLADFASTRFTCESYFSHGLETYAHKLRNTALILAE